MPGSFPMRALALCILAGAPVLAAGLQEPERSESGLAERVQRDARVSFSLDSARRARAALDAGLAEPEARAQAALTLGCAGGPGDLGRLEAMRDTGSPAERRAALLALGEMGALGLPALERALAQETKDLEPVLVLALAVAARRGSDGARTRLEALREDAGELGRFAREALGSFDDALTGLAGMAWLRYELRWRAARAYGLVDGQRGSAALAAELDRNEEFLDRVVLAASRELPEGERRAHLVEILLSGAPAAALAEAAIEMPAELVLTLRGGLVGPQPEGWRAILAAIEDQGLERERLELLQLAFQHGPVLEPLAGRLLLRGGDTLSFGWIRGRLESAEAEERRALVEACGASGDLALVPDLAEFLERRGDPELDGVGCVALARLAHPAALERLAASPSAPASEERDRILAALARALEDPGLRRHALAALKAPDLALALRVDLLTGLALAGAPAERAELRGMLLDAPRGPRRTRCVRALARAPDAKDLAALAELFPIEDDLDLDVELAVVLLRERHPSVGHVLHAALWTRSWNRSVLAGGLILRAGGARALLDEVAAAPTGTTEKDLRRVGFALGEWGGLGAVEELSRARNEGDPLLQGALLGALTARSTEDTPRVRITNKDLQSGAKKAPGAGPAAKPSLGPAKPGAKRPPGGPRPGRRRRKG